MNRCCAAILFVVTCPAIGQVPYAEHFDSYATGSRIAMNDGVHWRTWSDLPGSAEDPLVVDTPFQSPSRALAFVQTMPGSAGGPERVLWLLGDLITGAYLVSWSMYVPAGKGAGFLLYNGSDLSTADPCILVSMHASGNIELYVEGIVIDATFPQDVWFDMVLAADLDERSATLYRGTAAIASWDLDVMLSGTTTLNRLGMLYFLAGTFNNWELGEYYLDDMTMIEGHVGIADLGQQHPPALTPSPNPSDGHFTLDLSLPSDLDPQGDLLLQVFDGLGRQVAVRSMGRSFQQSISLDLSHEPAGMYGAHVSDGRRIICGTRLMRE